LGGNPGSSKKVCKYIPHTFFMIIHSNIKIKDYQKTVLDNKSGFHGGEVSSGMYCCLNPDCRSKKFYRHGTYDRYFISLSIDPFANESKENEWTLSCLDGIQTQLCTILRLKCTGCGQTHAILPEDIVPFHQMSLLLQLLTLVQIFKNDDKSSTQRAKLHQTDLLSWAFLRALFLTYQNYHSKMMHTLRINNIYTVAEMPSDEQLLKIYIASDPPARSLFRAVFLKQLFMTRRNTGSYPIRIIIH